MSKRTATWLLIVITISGIIIRLYHLTARSLWFDEAFSWRLIQFPWTEMISRAAADVHPPLYYLILKAWAFVFGSSLLSLRTFSVVLAAFAIVLIYLFCVTAFRSRSCGLVAAALLAFSGWQVQFAWEARMYTFGTVLLLLSSWLLISAIQQKKQRLMLWLGYALATVALAYVHYYAFFSIFAQVLFIIFYLLFRTKVRLGEIVQLRVAWYALLSGAVMFLLFIPWLPTFLAQNSQVQDAYWIPPLGGWSVPDTFYRMFIPTSNIPLHSGLQWVAIALLPITITTIAWIYLFFIFPRRHRAQATAAHLVVLSGVVPFIVSILLSLFSQSLYQDRFFVFAHIFIIILVAAILTHIRWRWLRVLLLLAAIALFIFAAINFWQELDIQNKPGARAATNSIFQQYQENEPVIVTSPFVYFAILHYAQHQYGNDIPKLYSESGELSHFAGGPILTDADITGPEIFTSTVSDIWAVDTTGFGGSKFQPPSPWREIYSTSYPEVFSHQGDILVTKYTR